MTAAISQKQEVVAKIVTRRPHLAEATSWRQRGEGLAVKGEGTGNSRVRKYNVKTVPIKLIV